MATTVTLRIVFTTSVEGEYFRLSLSHADPTLADPGGLAKVQAAAAAIITEQPFADVSLSAFNSADIITRTTQPVDI